MVSLELISRPGFLVVMCAGAYAGATIAMKAASDVPNMTSFVFIVICLAIAVFAEILLMQRFDIGVTYIAILAAETMLVLIAAYVIGEGLNPTQILGAVMVLSGAALVTA